MKPHIPAAPKIHQHYHRGLGSASSPWQAGVSLTLALHKNFGAKATKSLTQMGQCGQELFWTSSHGLEKGLAGGYRSHWAAAAWPEVAKTTSAMVSLNCCRQSTRYHGTLREGRVNKAAEERRPGFRVKQPLLQNSENNQLDRFQKQTSFVPLQCLLESCYAEMSVMKNSPADLWGPTASTGRSSEQQRPHPAHLCPADLFQAAARAAAQTPQNKTPAHLCSLTPSAWQDTGPRSCTHHRDSTGTKGSGVHTSSQHRHSEDPQQQDSLHTRADAVQDKARRSKHSPKKFRPGHSCQVPPSPQIYKPKYKQGSPYLTSKTSTSTPLSQEWQKVIWTFSPPPQSPLRLHSSILNSQTSPRTCKPHPKAANTRSPLISRDGRSPFKLTQEQNWNKHQTPVFE